MGGEESIYLRGGKHLAAHKLAAIQSSRPSSSYLFYAISGESCAMAVFGTIVVAALKAGQQVCKRTTSGLLTRLSAIASSRVPSILAVDRSIV